MLKKWHDALLADHAGTQSSADSMDALETYANATNMQLSALSGHLVYEITGEDAQSFLQGQFCNDIAQVTPTQAQITGYCTPKGRLLALPTIVAFDGGYRLLVPADIAEAFIKRLSMFVMRSAVTITALEDWAAVGITTSSSHASTELEPLVGPLPVGALSVASAPAAHLIRWHDDYANAQPRTRYLRLATIESQLDLWAGCANAGKCSESAWRLGDISAGIPSITQGVLETFVPQMVNLQLINGLSFTKGCYPGQEIVARMQYLGKLKRHMRVFRLEFNKSSFDVNDNLKPGVTLCAGADENAGVVVDAMPVAKNAALVLAVTKVTANEAPFSLGQIPLAPADMPYELPSMEVVA